MTKSVILMKFSELMMKSVTSLMKFPKDRKTYWNLKYTYVLKFPKDRNILTNNLNSLMKFPKERNTLMCWNFSKTKIHLQRTMSIVWCNFPKTEIHLWWKVSIVWWNLHQLSDSHTGCTSIPLPNHMGNIKGGLVVGQWQQNGGAHWSNCRCLPPYS